VPSQKKLETVRRLLDEILAIFKNAERTSERFKLKAKSNEREIFDGNTDVTLQSFRSKIREIVIRRQKRTNFAKKVG
jgi:hypothetical protein